MPTASDFKTELDKIFHAAQPPHVDVKAGDLHRRVGDYPDNQKQRMPSCNTVMTKNMKPGDTILHQPPKGKGASLEIRYIIPR